MMIYYVVTCFRPFGSLQKEWFAKYHYFYSNEEKMNFIKTLPKVFKHWPFNIRYFTYHVPPT